MENKFDKETTASKLNIDDVVFNSKLHHLIEKLNCNDSYIGYYPDNSIMRYAKICNHDDGYLCEHRLQYIIDFLKNSSINVLILPEMCDEEEWEKLIKNKKSEVENV